MYAIPRNFPRSPSYFANTTTSFSPLRFHSTKELPNEIKPSFPSPENQPKTLDREVTPLTPSVANPSLEEQMQMGMEYRSQGNFKEAIKCFMLHEDTDPLALYYLGICHIENPEFTDIEEEKASKNKGIKYLEKAAEKYPFAYLDWANSVFNHKFKDGLAFALFRVAAEKLEGFPQGQAQLMCGIFCELGVGQKPNSEEAFKWYIEAFNNKVPEAAYCIYRLYEAHIVGVFADGINVLQDIISKHPLPSEDMQYTRIKNILEEKQSILAELSMTDGYTISIITEE